MAIVSPCKKINRSHTHRQRTTENTPDTDTHTHTTRTSPQPQPPTRTPPTNTEQRSKVARRRCVNVNTERNNPDSLDLDARLFPFVLLAVAPAVTMDEASSLSVVSARLREQSQNG